MGCCPKTWVVHDPLGDLLAMWTLTITRHFEVDRLACTPAALCWSQLMSLSYSRAQVGHYPSTLFGSGRVPGYYSRLYPPFSFTGDQFTDVEYSRVSFLMINPQAHESLSDSHLVNKPLYPPFSVTGDQFTKSTIKIDNNPSF